MGQSDLERGGHPRKCKASYLEIFFEAKRTLICKASCTWIHLCVCLKKGVFMIEELSILFMSADRTEFIVD